MSSCTIKGKRSNPRRSRRIKTCKQLDFSSHKALVSHSNGCRPSQQDRWVNEGCSGELEKYSSGNSFPGHLCEFPASSTSTADGHRPVAHECHCAIEPDEQHAAESYESNHVHEGGHGKCNATATTDRDDSQGCRSAPFAVARRPKPRIQATRLSVESHPAAESSAYFAPCQYAPTTTKRPATCVDRY